MGENKRLACSNLLKDDFFGTFALGGTHFFRPDILVRCTGGVLKRSTRADCKSAGYAFGGSNPPPSTTSAKEWNKQKRF